MKTCRTRGGEGFGSLLYMSRSAGATAMNGVLVLSVRELRSAAHPAWLKLSPLRIVRSRGLENIMTAVIEGCTYAVLVPLRDFPSKGRPNCFVCGHIFSFFSFSFFILLFFFF